MEVTAHFMGKVFTYMYNSSCHVANNQRVIIECFPKHCIFFNVFFVCFMFTGSYFARDASYSDRYAKSRNGKTKKMFVALVLVGNCTRGNNTLVRPPQKPNSQSFYDCCVDNESNPAIFVVFEKFQIYPEYIIEYS